MGHSGKRIAIAVLVTAAAGLASATGAQASFTGTVDGTVLTISGTDASESVAVGLGLDATQIGFDDGKDGTLDGSFPAAGLTEIRVQAGGGDDSIAVANLGTLLTGKTVRLTGGDGNDTISGGDAGETTDGGAGNDFIAGGRGNDAVSGGLGDDTFAWNPGDGSDNLDGGTGDDRLQFNGANVNENVDLFRGAAPGHVTLTRDVANITMDMVDVDRLELRLLGGTDDFDGADDLTGLMSSTLIVDGPGSSDATHTIDGTDLPDTIDAGDGNDTVAGGPGDDTILVTPPSGSDTIDGGAGDDRVKVSGTDNPETYTVDAVAGKTRVTRNLDGTAPLISGVQTVQVDALGGADTISAGDPGDPALELNGGTGDDTVNGSPGDDTIGWAAGDGSDTVDGGGGVDTFRATGTPGTDSFAVTQAGPFVFVARSQDGGLNRLSGTERVAVDALDGADTAGANTDLPAGFSLDLTGGPGDDTLTGANGPDILRGGDGTDVLKGGAAADRFSCGSPVDTLVDATSEDTVDPDCVAPAGPGPSGPGGDNGGPGGGGGLPAGFLGFAKPAVSADLKTLTVKVRSTHTGPIAVKLTAKERDAGQRKATTFKAVSRTIAPGTTATLKLATPRTLLKALQKAQRKARSHRVTRKPTLTLTNTATGGKSTLKPKIVVKRKR